MKIILSRLEEKLPELLEKLELKQFEKYLIGYPVDPEKTALCVRFIEGSNGNNKSVTFAIHAQLPGVMEETVYNYVDAVNEYIDTEFDPIAVGYTSGEYTFAVWDNPRAAITEIFWEVTLLCPKDDCDY
jgi:AAA+ ATPase superfamily predicted ATPase